MNPIPKYCDTPEKVEEWKVKRRAYFKARRQTPEYKAATKARNQTPEAKARRQTPEYKAYNKAYQKAYFQTPERKAAVKAYFQTPEYKAAVKARHQTPEYKAYQKARHQTPEYKAADKARNKDRYQTLCAEQFTADAFRMMQAASELAKALTNLSEPTPKNK